MEYKNQFYTSNYLNCNENFNAYKATDQFKQNPRIGDDINIVGVICELTCEPGVPERLSRFFYESCWNDNCKAASKNFKGQYRCYKCGNLTLRPKLRYKVDLLILSGSTTYEATSFECTKSILNQSEDYYLQYPNPSDLVLNNLHLLSNKKFSFILRPLYRGLIIQSCVALHNKWQN